MQTTEQATRAMIQNRPTWMLLTIWEVTEAQRDDARAMASDGPSETWARLMVTAAAQLIDWTIDELDVRYPYVLPRFYAIEDTADLQDLYRDAYRAEVAR